jgi:hypothetical protein
MLNLFSILHVNLESTKNILKYLQAFINRCLRKIFKIFWPNTRMTWKRTVAEEAGKAGKTLKEVRALAQN